MSMKAQLEFATNASEVAPGIASVKQSLESLGGAAAASGQQASGALKGIGAGGQQAATEVDAVTTRMARAIERATASAVAGSKGQAEYYRQLAQARGADMATLEPMLGKLDEAIAKQKALGGAAISTSRQMAMVAPQMTDIVTSLISGQPPMMVMLQQGGQLKDVFGGVGNAAKALGGYVLSLINPITVAAAVAAAFGYALYQGKGEAQALADALVKSGNAAGLTVGELRAVSTQIADTTGATRGAVVGALEQVVAAGNVGAAALLEVTEAAVRLERAGGQAIKDTVADMASLGRDPVEASLKLNEQTRYLTASVYEQIKALQDQGRTVEAAELAQRAYAQAMQGQAEQLEQNMGTLERAARGFKDIATSAWDAVVNIGRATPLLQQLADARERAAANGGLFGSKADAEWEVRVLEEAVAAEQKRARAKAESTAHEQANIKWMQEGEKYLTSAEKLQRAVALAQEQGVSAGKTQEDINRRILQVMQQMGDVGGKASRDAAKAAKEQADELSKVAAQARAVAAGVNTDYVPALLKLKTALATNKITQQEYTSAVDALLKKQPSVIAAAKEEAEQKKALEKQTKDLTKEREREEQAIAKRVQALDQQIDRTIEETARVGASKDQIRQLELARLDDAIAIAEWETALADANGESTESIRLHTLELQRLRELRAARGALFDKQAEAEAAAAIEKTQKQYTDGWAKENEQLSQSIYDAIVNGGKNGWEVAKNAIEAAIVKPIIMPIIQGISGAALGLLGGNASASGLGGSYSGGLLGALGLGDFGAGWQVSGNALASGGFSGAWGSMTGAFDNGQYLLGLGQAMPWLGAALGVVSLLSGAFGGETRGGGQYGYNFGDGVYNARRGTWLSNPTAGVNLLEGPSGGEIGGGQVPIAIANTVQGINGLLASLGSSATLTQFSAGLETSDNGRGGVFAGGRLSNGRTFGESGQGDNYQGTLYENGGGDYTAEEAMQAFGLDLQQATIQALQAAGDLPQIIADQIAGIDAESLSAEAAQAIITGIATQVANADALQTAFAPLGGALSAIADSSLQARLNIIQLSGGIDALSANAQGYISNYYSADEQNAITANGVAQRLIDAGVDISGLDTREEFRALVDSLQANIEDPVAQEQLAALLSVQGGFAQLTDYMQAQGLDLEHLANLSPGGPLAEAMTAQADTSAETADNTSQIADTQAQMLTAQREQTGEIKTGLQSVSDKVAALAAVIEAMGDKILARPVEVTLPASNDLNWGQS